MAALLSPAFAKLLDLPKCYHQTCAKAGRDQHEKKVQIGKRAHKLGPSQGTNRVDCVSKENADAEKDTKCRDYLGHRLLFGKYGLGRA